MPILLSPARMVALLYFLLICILNSNAETYSGSVIDSSTQQPVAHAVVTLGQRTVQTNRSGLFQIDGDIAPLMIRAPGYTRRTLSVDAEHTTPLTVALTPFLPKALYLSRYGVGSAALRSAALALIEKTELNALVIDVKSDDGMLSYRSNVPGAMESGANAFATIKDVRALIDMLHGRGIYLIARIVVFKDNRFARAYPEFAVRSTAGFVWHDREAQAWSDPFQQAARAYNIELAVEAAAAGFDEIQFDYARFPDAQGLLFSQPNTQIERVATIGSFFAQASKRLTPYNVFLAADIFGYVCWNTNDTGIGQRLEALAPTLDYISPMLYPSGFQFGIPGLRNPVSAAGDIVYRSLAQAQHRLGTPALRFRPWLQAFKDYAFDRRHFDSDEIRAQIDAAEKFGSGGWMLRNPRNVYSSAGLKPAAAVVEQR